MKGLYAIRSSLNNKWFSNLFEDEHEKIFQGESLEDVYYWNIKQIAEEIANVSNGVVVDLIGFEE